MNYIIVDTTLLDRYSLFYPKNEKFNINIYKVSLQRINLILNLKLIIK